eukprot:3661098-Pyramimonas_sp.AAC.1
MKDIVRLYKPTELVALFADVQLEPLLAERSKYYDPRKDETTLNQKRLSGVHIKLKPACISIRRRDSQGFTGDVMETDRPIKPQRNLDPSE